MSKTEQQRLRRIESLVVNMATLGAQALRKIKNGVLISRLSVAGAQTFNLPAATGEGGRYRIVVGITATGNKIIKAAGTDIMAGMAGISGTTSGTFGTAANSNTITFNGSTTGGVIGTIVELWDMAPGQWAVQVSGVGAGTAATCFSNT